MSTLAPKDFLTFLKDHNIPEFMPEYTQGADRWLAHPSDNHYSYIAHTHDPEGNECSHVCVKSWRSGEVWNYWADPKTKSKAIKLVESKIDETTEKYQRETAIEAEKLWNAAKPPQTKPHYADTKYLETLGDIKVSPDAPDTMLIPLYDDRGSIWSIQKIYPNGDKFFLPGSKTKGVFFTFGSKNQTELIPNQDNPKRAYLCEGYATGSTIHTLTKCPVFCAVSALNVPIVAQILKAKYGESLQIIVACDNDAYTEQRRGLNPGLLHGVRAAKILGSGFVYPRFKELKEKQTTDFNDLLREEGDARTIEQLDPNYAEENDFIPSKKDGFYTRELTKTGEKLTPEYGDLAQYFYNLRQYRVGPGETVLSFDQRSKTYQPYPTELLASFAEDNFYPKPSSHIAREFTQKILRTRVISQDEINPEHYTHFQNGVWNQKANEFYPRSKELERSFVFTYCLDYDYDPTATAPRFEKLMADITQGDDSLRLLLLEFMGYALSNDPCWAEKILILVGEGANGKSTFIRILNSLAGIHGSANLGPKDLVSRFGGAALVGRFFNCSEELPTSFDSPVWSQLKNLASGGLIQIEEKFKPSYNIVNKTKLIMACNELPYSPDVSFGLFRKLIIAPFNATFTRENGNLDINIMDKIRDERSGIFNLARGSYLAAKKRGYLTIPESSKELAEEYKEQLDQVSEFMAESVTFDESKFPPAHLLPDWAVIDDEGTYGICLARMHKVYMEWAKNRGAIRYSKHSFCKRASRFFLENNFERGPKTQKRTRVGGVRLRIFPDASCRNREEF